MREAIGTYWLTAIVLVFIVLFTGYLCLSINMNREYKVKNEVINIIKKYNGFNDQALKDIQEYMNKVGYRNKGTCKDTDGDGFNLTDSGIVTNNTYFCVKQIATHYEKISKGVDAPFPDAVYYQVKVFFSVDLPIIRGMFTFPLTGSTKKIFDPHNLIIPIK